MSIRYSNSIHCIFRNGTSLTFRYEFSNIIFVRLVIIVKDHKPGFHQLSKLVSTALTTLSPSLVFVEERIEAPSLSERTIA